MSTEAKRFAPRGRRKPADACLISDPNIIATRSWRETSDGICRANSLPPGFRIVVLDEHGRALRSTFKIQSGEFGSFPRDFGVWRFLKEGMACCVKNWNGIEYDAVELRDHRNRTVDNDLTLRQLRDMTGLKGRHSQAWENKDSDVGSLVDEIEESLQYLTEQGSDPNEDVLLRALFCYIFGKYEYEDINYIAGSYLDSARKRYEYEQAQARGAGAKRKR